jgi:oxalate decarboxylase/phosphoglucose isomerase-like protein (cupin superfamily)
MKVESKIIHLPKFLDPRGNLSFIEDNKQIPFEIARTYWIYDVPGGESRGGHAYHELQEFIVALSGSFDVILNDGNQEYRFNLNRSYYGLYVPKMMWRSMENFSTNSLALVVADKQYDESDYIRDFNDFTSLINAKKYSI